jgi:hypothetical protein
MNSTTIGPCPSKTSGLNVLLVTVCMLSFELLLVMNSFRSDATSHRTLVQSRRNGHLVVLFAWQYLAIRPSAVIQSTVGFVATQRLSSVILNLNVGLSLRF